MEPLQLDKHTSAACILPTVFCESQFQILIFDLIFIFFLQKYGFKGVANFQW